MFDAAIIGGGVAGLQAALTLGRAQRRVLLVDEGKPRHRFAATMHNFIGADGLSIDAFYARAASELAGYPQVLRLAARVTQAEKVGDIFRMMDSEGAQHDARQLLFAAGIRDILPAVDGLSALWGREVLHCSFCHGYEVRGRAIAVLTNPSQAWSMVESLSNLTETMHFYFEGGQLPDAALHARLEQNRVVVKSSELERVERTPDGLALVTADGQRSEFAALFIKPATEMTTDLPLALGCLQQDGFIQVNSFGMTHAPGVYVAGDMAGGVQQLAVAAASGLLAGMMMSAELTRASLR